MDLQTFYSNRPFRTRNADEYPLEEVMRKFVNPIVGLVNPFEFESSIISGKKGSGKTMYLKANQAFYQFSFYSSIYCGGKIIIPIYLPLSRFSHLTDNLEIYNDIILNLCESLIDSYKLIYETNSIIRLQTRMAGIPEQWLSIANLREAQKKLIKMSAQEFAETTEHSLTSKLGAKNEFLSMGMDIFNKIKEEYKHSCRVDIKTLIDFHRKLLSNIDADILLLLDEAGSLPKDFFISKSNPSYFDIMMNQFRTSGCLKTKLAIYPDTPSDAINETRYGNKIDLEDDIETEFAYLRFRTKVKILIERYLISEEHDNLKASDFFEIFESNYGDALEQLIYASHGNMRLFVQMTDLSMVKAFETNNGTSFVTKHNVIEAIKVHANNFFVSMSKDEQAILEQIAFTCKQRQAYKFSFPYNTAVLNRIANKSDEYNLLKLVQLGQGQKPHIFSIDYCFAVANNIPTHIEKESTKVLQDRSCNLGRWNNRECRIVNDSDQKSFKARIRGMVINVNYEKDNGNIIDANKIEYTFWFNDVKNLQSKDQIKVGVELEFDAARVLGSLNIAHNIEIIKLETLSTTSP